MAEALNGDARPLRMALEILLRPYGQILLSRDLRTGALVALAVFSFPRLGLATLLAVVVAAVTTWLFGLGSRAVREGIYACTAVLTTLATALFAPGGGHPLVLVVIGAVVSVWLTASFEAAFTSLTLPSHSFPFVLSAWLVHLAARSMPAEMEPTLLMQPLELIPEWLLAPTWLDVPAAVLFLHGTLAGLLTMLALALHSRIALVLGVLGGLVAALLRAGLRPELEWSGIDTVASFNAVLTAMALGGLWFVPQPSSILLALAGSAVSVFISYALAPVTAVVLLPVLSLPFVVTVHLVLMAARRRQADRSPRSTLPAERPEEAVARHLSRLRRFGDAAWLPFRLPFRGEWVVTQGHDGEHTHQGPWRHGLDFEGVDQGRHARAGQGANLRDFACYNLPVVAAGSGTVVEVVDGIQDNQPGQIDTHHVWGNAVVIAHGPSLYSVYAHLKPRSIAVRQGELVQAGREIARCGNSGRSPVPHLHFQLQRTPALGSPTLPGDFGDVVTAGPDGDRLQNLVVPAEGDRLRPVMRDETIARALAFTPGTAFELTDGDGNREVARVQIDLLGRRLLESERARLQMDPYDTGFVVVDFEGDPRSLLRFVLVALARVPFDKASELSWSDSLPRRLLLPGWLRTLADLVAVVLPRIGSARALYRYRRAAGELQVLGEHPDWSSQASLSLSGGSHRLTVRHKGRETVVEMRPLDERERGRAATSVAVAVEARLEDGVPS